MIVAFVTIEHVNAEPNFFRPPKQCENQSQVGQEQCVKEFCAVNVNKFVCQALQCKQGNTGEGILQQFAKLKCIQNVCTSNPSEAVCQKLQECEAKKNAKSGALVSYIECIVNLFSTV